MLENNNERIKKIEEKIEVILDHIQEPLNPKDILRKSNNSSNPYSNYLNKSGYL